MAQKKEKRFFCEVCGNKGWTTNAKYKAHFSLPTHLENQAVYDGNLKVYYEGEIDKLRAELKQVSDLLEDNRKLSRDRTRELKKAEEKIRDYEKQSWIRAASNS
jgi:hypothetical protein